MILDTLDLWRRSGFIWGQTDCIMATCNHVRDETGIDPAAPWRGTYDDEAGAIAIYSAYGGVLALFRHGMGLAGFQMTDAMQDGFPVVCDVAGHEVAGIIIGPRVAFMAAGRGVVEMRAKVLAGWSL
jgi:hypothetical protein